MTRRLSELFESESALKYCRYVALPSRTRKSSPQKSESVRIG